MKYRYFLKAIVFILFLAKTCSNFAAATPVYLYGIDSRLQLFELIGEGKMTTEEKLSSRLDLYPTKETTYVAKPSRDDRCSYFWNSEFFKFESSEYTTPEESGLRLKLKRGTQPLHNIYLSLFNRDSAISRIVTANKSSNNRYDIQLMDQEFSSSSVFNKAIYQVTPEADMYPLSSFISQLLELKKLPVEHADIYDDIFYTNQKSGITIYAARDTDFQTIIVRTVTPENQHFMAVFGKPLATIHPVPIEEGTDSLSDSSSHSLSSLSRSPSPGRKPHANPQRDRRSSLVSHSLNASDRRYSISQEDYDRMMKQPNPNGDSVSDHDSEGSEPMGGIWMGQKKSISGQSKNH